jgi:hypothetical protein
MLAMGMAAGLALAATTMPVFVGEAVLAIAVGKRVFRIFALPMLIEAPIACGSCLCAIIGSVRDVLQRIKLVNPYSVRAKQLVRWF